MTTARPARRGLVIAPLLGGCVIGLTSSWNIANTGAVATQLAGRYGTGLAVVGLLTTVLFFAELAVMIPGGRAIDRHGARRAGVLAALLLLGGNLLLLTTTEPVLALALRGLVGLGVGLGFLSGMIYAQAGVDHGAALSSGIYGGVSLGGGGLALAIVPALEGALGWRAPYWSAALVAALALPVLAVCPSTPRRERDHRTPSLRSLLADRRLARLGLIGSVSFGFSVILGNWVVTLLERTGGYHRTAAGAVGSLILALGIVGRPAGGVLVRALPGATWRVVAASFLAGGAGAAMLALSAGRALDVLGGALTGLAGGIPFGATLVGATRVHPSAPGSAVGTMNIYPVLTIVAGVPLIGLTFSLPGDGRIGFAALAVLWAAAVILVPGRLSRDG